MEVKNAWKPCSRADVIPRETGREKVLYDPLSGEVHTLNETAELIWTFCDGRHTVADMEAAIRSSFEVPRAVDLRDDIERTLGRLRRRRLLLEPPRTGL